jgi:arginase
MHHRPIRTIDLFGIPSDAGASCRGSRMGPEALRVAGLGETLATLVDAVIDRGDLPRHRPSAGAMPWQLSDDRRDEVLALARQSSARALASLRGGRLPVFMGGDHSLSMGTISGVARHCAARGKPLFVLWIDAHGDFNTPASSETGNLHGMPLALLCGEPDFDTGFQGDWRGLVDPRNATIFAPSTGPSGTCWSSAASMSWTCAASTNRASSRSCETSLRGSRPLAGTCM